MKSENVYGFGYCDYGNALDYVYNTKPVIV